MMATPLPVPPAHGRPPPLLHRVRPPGAVAGLAVTDWLAAGSGVAAGTCVFIHATGFHARCWDAVVRRLPLAVRCLAVDVRGHGLSDKPTPARGYYPWPELGREVAGALRHLGIEGALGVGHSMGGFMVLHAGLEERGLFRGVLLLDPTVFTAETYDNWSDEQARQELAVFAPINKRFDRFVSADEMHKRLGARGSYAVWRDECLRDYCAHGLLSSAAVAAARRCEGLAPSLGTAVPHGVSSPEARAEVANSGSADATESLRLACPPDLETATYTGSRVRSDRERYASIAVPVVIVRAREPDSSTKGLDFTRSPTDPSLWRLFPSARDVPTDLTHFIPMQEPDLVVRHVLELGTASGALQAGLTAALPVAAPPRALDLGAVPFRGKL